jgi:quercetin dioxygenase-like cupin family protein
MYQIITHTDNLDWTLLDIAGVSLKILHKNAETGAMSVITKMEAGTVIPAHSHTTADETVYVLEGEFIENGVAHPRGSVFFGKAGTQHGPHVTTRGCLLLTHFSKELDFVLRENL